MGTFLNVVSSITHQGYLSQGRGQTGVEPAGGSGDWQFCALSLGQLTLSWRLMGPYHNSWSSPEEHPALVGSVALAQEKYFCSHWGLDSTDPKDCYPVVFFLPCIIFGYRAVPDLSLLVLWWPSCALHIIGLVNLELEQESRGLKWKGVLLSSHLGQLMARSSWNFALGFLKSTVWN